MNGFNKTVRDTIAEKGLPEIMEIMFRFKDNDTISFAFPITGDDLNLDLSATVERVDDSAVYKIVEEKLAVVVKYFEGLTI